MAKTSPTQRALAECKKRGWKPAIVEKWNPHARIRQDLYGFADLVVLDGNPGLLALQVTSGANLSARMAKLSAVPAVVDWLKAGLRVECWGYRKLVVKRGGKATRWNLRRVSARYGWPPADRERVAVGGLSATDFAHTGQTVLWTEVDESAPPLVDLPGSPT